MRDANAKFDRRFRYMERYAQAGGRENFVNVTLPGVEATGVIRAERAAQSILARAETARCRAIIGAEDRGACAQVRARVESIADGDAELGQVRTVNLTEAKVE